jgi:uncharacterized membrane protein YheB (UPF0754 family)
MKLYEINNEYSKAMEDALLYASENEGEIPEHLAEKMEALEIDKDEKIDTLIRMYKNECAIAGAIEAEIKCLKDRMKSHDNKIEWVKKYIRQNIHEGEKKELSCGKISWRKSSSVEIVDETKLPDFVFVVTKSVSKTIVKELITSGDITEDIATIKTSINMQVQ